MARIPAVMSEHPQSERPSQGPTVYRRRRIGRLRSDRAERPGGVSTRQALSKVPEVITVYFWIVKGLSTAMGESTSDYLVHRIHPVPAVLLGFAGFVVALLLQFAMRRYLAWTYWFAVVMVGVFGTMAADVLHVGLGVPYVVSTALFAVVLAAVFAVWQRSEGTLSIHSVTSRRRELFYWAAVVATFALGTAAGDLTAYTLHLGYLRSIALFAVAIAIPAIGYWRFRWNPILAFWFAYVVTRPLGASFADWMGKPVAMGGLGWGQGPVSLVLTAMIVAFVGYLAVSRKDVAIDGAGERPVAAGERSVAAGERRGAAGERLVAPEGPRARPAGHRVRPRPARAPTPPPRGLAVRVLTWLLLLTAAAVVAFFVGYLIGPLVVTHVL